MKTYNPVSTYRLQFNSGFRLSYADRIVDYLKKSGIRTIYASPLFRAVSGSNHGYDVTDPLSLNPEIGTTEELDNLVRRLHLEGMGWLQDFVPNHMAFSTENPWITDVLVHGKESIRYRFFDIVTDHPEPELRDKLMVPFFGKPLDELLQDRELKLAIGENGFSLNYFDDAYPVSRRVYPYILEAGTENEDGGGGDPGRLQDLLSGSIPPEDWEARMKQLDRDYRSDRPTAAFIDHCLEVINRDSFRMEQLVGRLTWIPVHWKETERRINYRRFFTINGLICVNIQFNEVFELFHTLPGSWISRSVIDGLRIDHIDGLYHPTLYLQHLRQLCGEEPFLVVEKILEKDEELPVSWPIQGSTGYDFLAMTNNLLTRSSNGRFFYDYYADWTGKQAEDPARVFLEKKRFILHHRLQGDLELLTHECQAAGIFEGDATGRDTIRATIAEFLVHCPVYKYYTVPSGFGKSERKSIRRILREAAQSGRAGEKELKVLEDAFLLKGATNWQTERVDRFFRRLMQFTGPLMAKGLEDTAFYTFNPFIAHNEVGDSPGYFGIDKEDFHRFMIRRQKKSPTTLNTLSTHDTKRGEDARARLNVLSDMPGQWKKASGRWREMNRGFKTVTADGEIPSPADEYLIYQALCAHLPMDGKTGEAFLERLEEYLVKALREGKERSSWSEPDQEYEEKTIAFCRAILSTEHNFLESLHRFMELVIPHGIINSLTQVILRNTVPGVPDIFQGSEKWNFSFVDPDNRRPVDYDGLYADLDRMIRAWSADRELALDELWKEQRNGSIKQWISYLILRERVNDPELFLKGAYIPLPVKGAGKDHLIAFCRSYRDHHLLVALPLNTATLPGDHDWGETFIQLPALFPIEWEDLFTGKVHARNGALAAAVLLEKVPFSVLKGIPNQPEKRAGILLHISSLPGSFATGDPAKGDSGKSRYRKSSYRKSGSGKSGSGKSGSGKSGSGKGEFETGDFGTGDFETGDFGTGDFGTGDFGTGDFETGDFGTGDFGTGDFGTGDFGTGDFGTGDFGTGDFGVGAYRFVDFLQASGQRYWQILPLSAVSSIRHYSPYSSRSAFAGNILFVDPYQLVQEGLLDEGQVDLFRQPSFGIADYAGAERTKTSLLNRAYRRFRKDNQGQLREKMVRFLEREKYWIDDYALFEVLKEEFAGAPWFDWPPEFRDRSPESLEKFRHEHSEAMERVFFGQFIFSEQWNRLKQYAHDRGVDIFGDLPIYIDHDSADAWTHPHLFRLRDDCSMDSVAGVPPDYFNSEGQLWGMPLYNWENMEADGFRWWLHRIGRNLQWYDLLRLDHFRGFSAYWEVPPGDGNAKNGKWVSGPGTRLFDAIREQFPDMPLVAEDLGQIDQPVFDLRDHYHLPGMKVLQFGFGNHMAFSHHSPGNIPYHCILYTGTHDNNTLVGWYRNEAGKKAKRRFRMWTGNKLTEKNVHEEMIRVAFSSPARLVIIPMQDWMGLDERSRMNIPSSTGDNWLWRVDPAMLKKKVARKIRKKAGLFGRF